MQGYGHSGPKDEPFRHYHDGGAGEKFDLILPASKKEDHRSPARVPVQLARGYRRLSR